MTIRDIAANLNAEIMHDGFNNEDITKAYTSDLLSDVMANAKEGGALITVQAHKNTVAVASLVNIHVIIVCNSRIIPEDMVNAAKDEGIAILLSKENQFTVSGKLYKFFDE